MYENSLLLSDVFSLVKVLYSSLMLALVDSPLAECMTFDYSCDLQLFFEGVFSIVVLCYVFYLFDDGCDSRSVVFSNLLLYDSIFYSFLSNLSQKGMQWSIYIWSKFFFAATRFSWLKYKGFCNEFSIF